MAEIPASHRDLLENTNFAHIATVMADGSPQVTPVWVDIDGNDVLINTAVDRLKDRNLVRDGRVALSIHDQSNPYRYIQIRGEVAARTTEGGDAHIDRLAKKYMNLDSYPYRTDTETRVIYRIKPLKVQVWG
ncbi:MAG TPA: PPOX class F420-dependent oxidoreductase [Tepidiformaceae bacterium]|nr:PPOX class F420-dependent oxidoreductase [Tepidiformaceae bacterium]